MSWYKTQKQMIEELNLNIFAKDPISKVIDPMSPIDVHNNHYIMELKNREAYAPETFNGSLREKMKYYYLIKNCGTKIPGYVCRFKDGSYWAWNLKKINEPKWYDKKLPETTHFERKEWINKKVGDLTLQEGVKLI